MTRPDARRELRASLMIWMLLPVLVSTACTAHRPEGAAQATARAAAMPHSTGDARHEGVDRLAWLAGCWAGTLSNGALYEEVWLAPRAGTMLGVARMSAGERTLSWEFMRIHAADGVLVYSAQPEGRPATDFRAAAVGSGEIVFENDGHDFPQRIRYRHTAPDVLDARIEGTHEGRASSFDFPLRRAACPPSPPTPR